MLISFLPKLREITLRRWFDEWDHFITRNQELIHILPCKTYKHLPWTIVVNKEDNTDAIFSLLNFPDWEKESYHFKQPDSDCDISE